MTLSQLARVLDLNLSTCQTILAALEEAGFVVRSPTTKAYTLGPALIVLGDAARALTPLLAQACRIIDELHSTIRYGCTLLMASRDELIVVHRTSELEDFPVPAMAEGPFPFVPPFGATIVAAAPPDVRSAWLGRIGERNAETARYSELLDTIRKNGWCAWRYTGATQELFPQFNSVLHGLSHDTHSLSMAQHVLQLLALAESRGYTAEEIDRATTLSVTMITVPAQLPTTALEVHVYLYEKSIAKTRLENVARAAQLAAEAIGALDRAGGR
jgi:hypothetical protein